MKNISRNWDKIEFPARKRTFAPEISETRTLGEVYDLNRTKTKSISLRKMLKQLN